MFDVMIVWTVAIAEDRLVPEGHPYRVRALPLDPGKSLNETLAQESSRQATQERGVTASIKFGLL